MGWAGLGERGADRVEPGGPGQDGAGRCPAKLFYVVSIVFCYSILSASTLSQVLLTLQLAAVQISGSITYNGADFSQFNVRRTATYVAQRDIHTGSLTVRETFGFAAACQGSWLDRRGTALGNEAEELMLPCSNGVLPL